MVSGTSAYNLAYGYDAQGNVIQRGNQTYVLDQANRLNSALGKGTYAYDGHGRRVSVVGIDAVNRVQVYSQEGKMLYTRATSVPLASGTKYIYLGRHVIAENSAAGVQYEHTDALGSPVAISNAAGTVTSRTRYEAYGLTASGTVPVVGFTGHMNAEEIGLVYMQQRYYDPVAGRFLSIDPVTTDVDTGGSFNRYVYANNSPYKYVDPDGRSAALAACVGGPIACGVAVIVTVYVAYQVTVSPVTNGPFTQNQSGDGSNSEGGGTNSGETKGGKGSTEHGDQRADEATTDANRQVGDRNKVVDNGRKYIDDHTGNTVHVDGDRVVITDTNGNVVTQFKNPRKNTNTRVEEGRWIPVNKW